MNYFQLLIRLCSMKRIEKMTPKQLMQLQEERLRQLLKYAFTHSEYYRESFTAAGVTEDNIEKFPLNKFPSVNKQLLMENFESVITVKDISQHELRLFDESEEVSRKPYKGKYHVVHTSGSTGNPAYFLYDNRAWNTMLLGTLRGALWGMSMKDVLRLLAQKPRIAYIAAADGRYGGAMAVGDGVEGIGAEQMYLDVKLPVSRWIAKINAFQPNIVIGYPSAVKILAGLVKTGKVKLNVKRVISCGEPLGKELRRYLEKAFHTKVINFYGASESLALGVEASEKEGMLLFDDLNIIESSGDGIYLTCLYNYAQPLIRYRISDRLILKKPHHSKCPFTRAVGLMGRDEDIMWFKQESGTREFIHPLSVEGFCIDGLLDYRFVQKSDTSFTVEIQTNKAACERIKIAMFNHMKRILAEKGLDNVKFNIQDVKKILPDPKTGKKKLIVKDFEESRE